jgi:NADH:ubiquinone oxidoreductase subunit F (NADH-binding)/NADH:ubiquinone oxidoreductase subunit E
MQHMIVQELRAIQDRRGYLPEGELRAVSDRLGVPLHRLHEVASFFPHFRKVPPPAVDVRVCRDMACHLRGSKKCQRALKDIANEIGADRVHVGGVSCLGQCDGALALTINDIVFWGKTQEQIEAMVRAAALGNALPPQHASRAPLGWKIDAYNGQPRYDAVRKFVQAWEADKDADLKSRRKRVGEPVINAIKAADLRGMGGAGFRTHIKWTTVRDEPGDVKYVVCNGDESEPGTFKDRELLRRAPWLLIEGMVLAGLVTGAERGWIYVRHEYHEEIEVMEQAIHDAQKSGFCGSSVLGSSLSFPLEVFVSPGGYICGEESALLEAMEDRRAEPRNKPPFPVQEGLYGKPTVINNVETLSWVPAIVLHGGDWYRNLGTSGASGMRFVSISGDVRRPGVYEVPLGQTVRELIFDTAGGMRDGVKLKAIAPSGPSGGFLPAELNVSQVPKSFADGLVKRGKLKADATTIDILDVPLDFDTMNPFPDFMLGAAFVVYGDQASMVDQALNCLQFYRNESCGKCVPCRLGSQKLVEMITEIAEGRFKGELSLVDELSDAMLTASICGLGKVAPNPIRTVMKYFRSELEQSLRRTRS